MEAAWHGRLAMGKKHWPEATELREVHWQVSLASLLPLLQCTWQVGGTGLHKERLHGGVQVDQDESSLLPRKVRAVCKGLPV